MENINDEDILLIKNYLYEKNIEITKTDDKEFIIKKTLEIYNKELKKNMIEELPIDLLLFIFGYLSCNQMGQFSYISKNLNKIIIKL